MVVKHSLLELHNDNDCRKFSLWLPDGGIRQVRCLMDFDWVFFVHHSRFYHKSCLYDFHCSKLHLSKREIVETSPWSGDSNSNGVVAWSLRDWRSQVNLLLASPQLWVFWSSMSGNMSLWLKFWLGFWLILFIVARKRGLWTSLYFPD